MNEVKVSNTPNFHILTDDELKERSEEYLPEVAKITLIDLKTLQDVKGKYQWEIVKNFYSDNYDLGKIHSILGKGISENIIAKLLSFMCMDKKTFDSLKSETKDRLIGCYDMEVDIIPDEELRKELEEIREKYESGDFDYDN